MSKEEYEEDELFIDDRPRDLSYLSKYTDEEIEKMFQERFGEFLKPESEDK